MLDRAPFDPDHPQPGEPFAVAGARPARQNCFDVVRLILALLVVYTHAFLLAGAGEEPTFAATKRQFTAGQLAVLGFFGISGYLIAASWERSTLIGFLRKRLLRIMPAFLVCLAVVALVIGPFIWRMHGGTFATYPWIGPSSAATFVVRNALLMVQQWTIGGVLTGAPYAESLNGSLWSIFPECCCYLLTAAFGLLGAARRNRALLAGTIGYLAVLNAISVVELGPLTPARGPTLLMLGHGPIYVLTYLVGAALWIFREHFQPNPQGALIGAGVVALSLKFGGLLLIAPFALPLTAIYVSESFSWHLKRDLSYGVYLYHFPILQALAVFPALRRYPAVFLVVGAVVALLVAAASWHLVEKPALRWRATRKQRHAVPPDLVPEARAW